MNMEHPSLRWSGRSVPENGTIRKTGNLQNGFPVLVYFGLCLMVCLQDFASSRETDIFGNN